MKIERKKFILEEVVEFSFQQQPDKFNRTFELNVAVILLKCC